MFTMRFHTDGVMSLKRPIQVLCALLMMTGARALDPFLPTVQQDVFLWPEGKMPGKDANGMEGFIPPTGDGAMRLTNVGKPQLVFFKAPAESQLQAAVIVCPGGGYSYLTTNKEGSDVAKWLNDQKIQAFVLKYRVPDNRDGAFQDLQRAISMIRSRAIEWNVDPYKIGVIGFSAGGHLAAKAATLGDQRSYSSVDEVDKANCAPDFDILVYPAYLAGADGKLAAEFAVPAVRPRTLIIHSLDDQKHVAGTKLYYDYLHAADMDAELLMYSTGGHGYGLNSTGDARKWPADAAKWLQEKIIK